MARKKDTSVEAEQPPVIQEEPEIRIVETANKRGLNLREAPSMEAKILKVLPEGEQVLVDKTAAVPEGWVAVKDAGFVMQKFLR